MTTRGSRQAGRCFAAVLGLALAAAGETYIISATTAVSIVVPPGRPAGPCVLRGAGGTWREVAPAGGAAGERIEIPVTDAGTRGGAVLVVGKPEWMSLEDQAPPVLVAARIDERDLPCRDGHVDAGAVAPGGFALVLEIADADNPLDPAVQCVTCGDPPGPCPVPATEGLDGLSRTGRVRLTFAELSPGTFRGRLLVRDRSPAAGTLAVPWSFTVPGIAVAADRSVVRLATPAGEFLFQAGREQQLRLPDGRWAKLTTRHGNTWLYPRAITDVRGPEPLPQGQRVTVTTNTQDIDGKPVEGLAVLEYEFTVRADVPGLVVRTRSLNAAAATARMEANWGWLPGAYYVAPEGRREWTGRATDRYVAVGKPGWLWLAPAAPGTSGLAWVSPMAFGESRFDTMLLYGEGGDRGPNQSVDIAFALAPADTPEAAAALALQYAAAAPPAPP